MLKLKHLLWEHFYRPALKLPDGEVIEALPNERAHFQIYDRLVKSNHPNVLRRDDPDVEDGFVDDQGNYLSRDELSKILGHTADTFAKVF